MDLSTWRRLEVAGLWGRAGRAGRVGEAEGVGGGTRLGPPLFTWVLHFVQPTSHTGLPRYLGLIFGYKPFTWGLPKSFTRERESLTSDLSLTLCGFGKSSGASVPPFFIFGRC